MSVVCATNTRWGRVLPPVTILFHVRFIEKEGEVADANKSVAGEEGLDALQTLVAAERAKHSGVVLAHSSPNRLAKGPLKALGALASPHLQLGDGTQVQSQQLEPHLEEQVLSGHCRRAPLPESPDSPCSTPHGS